MSPDARTPDPSEEEADRDAAARAAAERRRRLDRVFGAVLADTTSDERGTGGGDERSREDELRRNVPPHHG